jgi:hypothetical protein
VTRTATPHFGQIRRPCFVSLCGKSWHGACMRDAIFLRRYAIKNVQVLATSARMIVQDCVEAEENTDARDKFFMYLVKPTGISCNYSLLVVRVAVPEFDPSERPMHDPTQVTSGFPRRISASEEQCSFARGCDWSFGRFAG